MPSTQNPRVSRQGMLAVAWLLACAMLLGGPQAGTALAQSQGGAIEVEVSAGFGDTGAYLIGEWMPVRVTLTNPPGGASRRVRVEVEGYGNDDKIVTGLFNNEVDLPSQSRKEVTLYTYSGAYTRAFRVYVREGNNLLVTKSAQAVPFEPPSNMIVGVASSDSSLLNGLGSERVGHIVGSLAPGMGQYGYLGPTSSGQGATAIVAHIALDDLPPAYQGWKALGALLLDDVDAGSLTPEQRIALETWVAEGGTLIVSARPGGGDSTSAIASLLPVAVSGTRSVVSLESISTYIGEADAPGGGATVGNAALDPGAAGSSRVLALQDGTVLLATRDVGRGRVIYMGASPALPPLKNWDGTVPLMKKLLADTPLRPSYGAYMRFGPSRGVYIGSMYGSYGSMFAMPGLDLPNAWLVGAFLLVYILIIGPLNFVILRRMRRAELAWITVPALVGLFSLGAYLLAFQAKGGEVVSIRASAITGAEGVPYAGIVQNYGLFSPVRRSYRLSMPAEATVTELNAYGYYQAGSDNPSPVYGGDTTVVDNVLINTWSLKAFMTEHAGRVEQPLEADLALRDGVIAGTVRNRLDVPLQDVVLVRGGATDYVGFIAAGGSAEVRLPLSSQVFNNASPVTLLPPPPGVSAPQPGYSYPYSGGGDVSAEQRTYNRKIDLLGIGLYPYFGDLPPVDMRVTLLAWGPPAPEPIAVERYTTKPDEVTLWMSQATVHAGDQPEQPLKSGTVPYTVYAPGNGIEWLAWGGLSGANQQLAPGQAFPQAVPTAGTIAITPGTVTLSPYADVRYSLPPGTVARTLRLDYTLGGGTYPIRMLAFNTRTGAWDQVGAVTPQARNTAIQVPINDAAPYVGPAGDLTIRLMPGDGSAAANAFLRDYQLDVAVNPEGQQ